MFLSNNQGETSKQIDEEVAMISRFRENISLKVTVFLVASSEAY